MLQNSFRILFAIANLFVAVVLDAQEATLVKDINQQAVGDFFTNSAIAGDNLFYSRFLPDTGYELWITNLTTGVSQLHDIRPGNASSDISEIFAVNDTSVVFGADDGVHGNELWVSDGTQAGTKMLLDINPGGSSFPGFFTRAQNGKVLFSADDGVHGSELWVSDLTPQGTKLFADIRGGPLGSGPAGIVTLSHPFANGADGYFMSADPDGAGSELVKVSFDGTQITNFNLNPSGGSFPYNLVVTSVGLLNPKLFFSASDGQHGFELFVSNGLVGGTYMVIDQVSGPGDANIGEITGFGGKVAFFRSSGLLNDELCVTDGTPNTINCFDINPGPGSSTPRGLAVLSGKVYFSAFSPSLGRELWRTDGSTVTQVADLNSGPSSSMVIPPLFSRPMVNFGNALYFVADDGVTGLELWRTDGTSTVLVRDLFPGSASSAPTLLGANASGLVFTALDGTKPFVWKSDGSNQGTAPVFDLSDGDNFSSSPANFFSVGNRLLFSALTPESGEELWTSDGTAAGTQLFKDIDNGSRPDNSSIAPLGDSGLFGFTGFDSRSFWHTDGTAAGTQKFSQPPRINASANQSFAIVAGLTYFVGESDLQGAELWRSDGTPAGTFLVRDIRTGMQGSSPHDFVAFGDKLMFGADDGTGDQLWISDGSFSGTKPLSSFAGGLKPSGLVEFNGKVIFAGSFPNIGIEPGISDGTPAGTGVLKDLAPGTNVSSFPSGYVRLGDIVLFAATESGAKASLMRTDGTPEGTFAIVSGGSGGFSTFFSSKAVVGNRVVFSAKDTAAGTELWSSDGTAEGTSLLKDIFPGSADSFPDRFAPVLNVAFFTARDAAHGSELWRTDGSADGTTLVSDISPGSTGSSPTNLYFFRGALYFSAVTPHIGAELWKVVLDECPDDESKTKAGQCGCGIPDNDSNSNGIVDCQGSLDLRAQLGQIRSLLVKIKPAKSKKAKKILKQNVALEKGLLIGLLNFTNNEKGFIQLTSNVSLLSLSTSVNKLVKKALSVKVLKFKQNKKKALKAIDTLLKALI